jgi:hypothetical protein
MGAIWRGINAVQLSNDFTANETNIAENDRMFETFSLKDTT